MSSVEKKCDKREPFYLSPCPKRKTSAEIISEARRSLRAVSTRRPFTPKDDQRHLFGQTSSRASEARPPSTFSLYARNFEESDSRPNSGNGFRPWNTSPNCPRLRTMTRTARRLSRDLRPTLCSAGGRAAPGPARSNHRAPRRDSPPPSRRRNARKRRPRTPPLQRSAGRRRVAAGTSR
ncbi:hypothetical protein ANANG_G00115750 [Anguilla anguilla]|uniref:Uncharacterized protein n=1 Tax=Anguilla anguilla TaxID=7936 RepID=A0A9D3MCK3_ANGAN|nr:hypothetical protein ANANG_G00115750 [Anguilla anguilla]